MRTQRQGHEHWRLKFVAFRRLAGLAEAPGAANLVRDSPLTSLQPAHFSFAGVIDLQLPFVLSQTPEVSGPPTTLSCVWLSVTRPSTTSSPRDCARLATIPLTSSHSDAEALGVFFLREDSHGVGRQPPSVSPVPQLLHRYRIDLTARCSFIRVNDCDFCQYRLCSRPLRLFNGLGRVLQGQTCVVCL